MDKRAASPDTKFAPQCRHTKRIPHAWMPGCREARSDIHLGSCSACRWIVMTRYFVLCPLLAAMMSVCVGGSEARFLPNVFLPDVAARFVKVGLDQDDPSAS